MFDQLEFLGKTKCEGCGDTIDAGEYRVVLVAVELGMMIEAEREFGDGPFRTWKSWASFCDTCVATQEELCLTNTTPASLEQMCGDDEGQAPAPSSEDEGQGRPTSDPLLAGKRLSPRLRAVSELWSSGKTQAEIAETLGLSQPTVSRCIKALKSRLE